MPGPLATWLIPRIAFYPSLAYGLAMDKLSTRQWYSRIDEHVLLGALPFKSMTQKLIEEEEVRGVVTMNEEYETRRLCNSTEEWKSWGVEQLRLDTPDMIAAPSREDMARGVSFIEGFSSTSGSVYVHCKAGRTRSACIVACYLMKKNNWTPEAAVEYIRTKRPQLNIFQTQWNALHDFHRSQVT